MEQAIIQNTQKAMEQVIHHLQNTFARIRAGKITPNMLDNIKVDYYGTPSPLTQVATITNTAPQTLYIKPWEKNLIPNIEQAIQQSDLDITPQNDGENIILNMPPLSEDRRKTIVKQVKHEAEQSKIQLRQKRKDANEELKKLKDKIGKDLVHDAEEDIQKLTQQFTKTIEQRTQTKEQEIMTV